MQPGMIGSGRMAASMAQRLLQAGHGCVVHDTRPDAVAASRAHGAVGANSLKELSDKRIRPRAVWLMLPAALVDEALQHAFGGRLETGDEVAR